MIDPLTTRIPADTESLIDKIEELDSYDRELLEDYLDELLEKEMLYRLKMRLY